MGVADPGWAARPPEANDLLLKAGTGVATMLANEAAWTAMGASHHAAGVASTINTALTSAQWLGSGSVSSAANVTMQNAALHGLGGWVDVKPAVVMTAVTAYQTATGAMRPAVECEANRTEWVHDNAINPLVFGALTPRIIALDVQYFGVMWPNNASVGASYGAVLAALTASLAIPPPLAPMGASPAAPATAAAAVGQAASETAAGAGMRAAHEGTAMAQSGAGQAASGAQGMMGSMSSMMSPVMSALPQAMQAPAGLMQAPQSLMGPMQGLMGMFMSPGMAGAAGGAAPASLAAGGAAAGGSAAGAGGGIGAGGIGSGAAAASSFTRPVSAFEPESSGRPVGLRPSGALGMDAAPAAKTTAMGGGAMGGMPVGHAAAAAARGGEEGRADESATVRVVDQRG